MLGLLKFLTLFALIGIASADGCNGETKKQEEKMYWKCSVARNNKVAAAPPFQRLLLQTFLQDPEAGYSSYFQPLDAGP